MTEMVLSRQTGGKAFHLKHHGLERNQPFPGEGNHIQDHQATRTLSTAFPNSRARTSPGSATGIRTDAPAYIPARDGGLREKACSTAFPRQPAKADPSRLSETSRPGLRFQNCALQSASPCSERRFRLIPHEPSAECSARGRAVVEPSN